VCCSQHCCSFVAAVSLHCVAVCRSVLQCVAVCCSVMQCVAARVAAVLLLHLCALAFQFVAVSFRVFRVTQTHILTHTHTRTHTKKYTHKHTHTHAQTHTLFHRASRYVYSVHSDVTHVVSDKQHACRSSKDTHFLCRSSEDTHIVSHTQCVCQFVRRHDMCTLCIPRSHMLCRVYNMCVGFPRTHILCHIYNVCVKL